MSNKANTKAVNMEVAINTPTAEVLSALDAKNKSLKRIEETPYKTTGNLEGFGDIKNEKKIENLIRAFASVQGRASAYEKAAEELGLSSYPAFCLSGGNVDDWKHDITLRMDIINYDETLTKLKAYKEKMSTFLSQAEQKEMLLKEMAAFLGSAGE